MCSTRWYYRIHHRTHLQDHFHHQRHLFDRGTCIFTQHEFIAQFTRDKLAFLDCFETFVVDEAHELRKPQLIILAAIREHLKRYPKKRLIVASATLETQLFEEYFRELRMTIIETETPTYSVQVQYNMFPDLETNVAENTVCHLKEILDVR
jgi:HrpA-like RNA helicase